jgi:steroid delta-isomerase-like uncharacterized protein
MSAEENVAQDRRFAQVVLTEHRLDQLDLFIHEDFVEENPVPGQRAGREGLRDFLAAMFAAFPDVQWAVHDVVGQDDTTAGWGIWEGTHRGEFMGVPPTGRRVSVEAWVLDRYRDGRVVSSRIIMDQLGLLQQLGVIPNRQPTADLEAAGASQ